ncbi:MAG: hypothetical protein HFI67_06970 [Lachnospiraceae bacterium]|nr:hypothetical protein [Lachnospiraceae bacterium]
MDRIRLKKLEEPDIELIEGRALYCYEKSEAYLSELKAEFPVLIEKLAGIVDDNKRNQGTFCWEGLCIPVEDSSWLFRIDWTKSVLLITSDYHREAYEKLSETLPLSGGGGTIYYYADRETEIEMDYREKYKDTELENIILFRSGPCASSYVKGMDFADNARALFEYMLSKNLNERYELVWLVKDPEEFIRFREMKNVTFLSFDWSVSEIPEEQTRYYRALCLARYIFFTDAYGFARNSRPDQIRVQLWHGCGFKTRVNFVRCEKRYEFTTVISDLYANIHQDIYGLRKDQTLVTGYAKEDWLFHPAAAALEKLNIPAAGSCIFWLPTFRTAKSSLMQLNEYALKGETGLPLVVTYEKMEELEQLLEELDTVLLIKLHPFQAREQVGQIHMEHIWLLDNDLLADMDIQINELLGHADGLISDYSSAAVDYMLLDRPIGFTLDDVEEYKKSRGFVFDNIREWLPGAELFSFEQLCTFIKDTATNQDPHREKRQRLVDIMHKYGDDQNCRRIVEALHI